MAERQRVSRACVICKAGKRKCDGEQPCSRCGALGLECEYLESGIKRGPKPGAKANFLVAENDRLRAELDKLRNAAGQRNSAPSFPALVPATGAASGHPRAAELFPDALWDINGPIRPTQQELDTISSFFQVTNRVLPAVDEASFWSMLETCKYLGDGEAAADGEGATATMDEEDGSASAQQHSVLGKRRVAGQSTSSSTVTASAARRPHPIVNVARNAEVMGFRVLLATVLCIGCKVAGRYGDARRYYEQARAFVGPVFTSPSQHLVSALLVLVMITRALCQDDRQASLHAALALRMSEVVEVPPEVRMVAVLFAHAHSTDATEWPPRRAAVSVVHIIPGSSGAVGAARQPPVPVSSAYVAEPAAKPIPAHIRFADILGFIVTQLMLNFPALHENASAASGDKTAPEGSPPESPLSPAAVARYFELLDEAGELQASTGLLRVFPVNVLGVGVRALVLLRGIAQAAAPGAGGAAATPPMSSGETSPLQRLYASTKVHSTAAVIAGDAPASIDVPTASSIPATDAEAIARDALSLAASATEHAAANPFSRFCFPCVLLQGKLITAVMKLSPGPAGGARTVCEAAAAPQPTAKELASSPLPRAVVPQARAFLQRACTFMRAARSGGPCTASSGASASASPAGSGCEAQNSPCGETASACAPTSREQAEVMCTTAVIALPGSAAAACGKEPCTESIELATCPQSHVGIAQATCAVSVLTIAQATCPQSQFESALASSGCPTQQLKAAATSGGCPNEHMEAARESIAHLAAEPAASSGAQPPAQPQRGAATGSGPAARRASKAGIAAPAAASSRGPVPPPPGPQGMREQLAASSALMPKAKVRRTAHTTSATGRAGEQQLDRWGTGVGAPPAAAAHIAVQPAVIPGLLEQEEDEEERNYSDFEGYDAYGSGGDSDSSGGLKSLLQPTLAAGLNAARTRPALSITAGGGIGLHRVSSLEDEAPQGRAGMSMSALDVFDSGSSSGPGIAPFGGWSKGASSASSTVSGGASTPAAGMHAGTDSSTDSGARTPSEGITWLSAATSEPGGAQGAASRGAGGVSPPLLFSAGTLGGALGTAAVALPAGLLNMASPGLGGFSGPGALDPLALPESLSTLMPYAFADLTSDFDRHLASAGLRPGDGEPAADPAGTAGAGVPFWSGGAPSGAGSSAGVPPLPPASIDLDLLLGVDL